jgi:hypothetical protein
LPRLFYGSASMLPLLSSPCRHIFSLPVLGTVSPRPEPSGSFGWHAAPPPPCPSAHTSSDTVHTACPVPTADMRAIIVDLRWKAVSGHLLGLTLEHAIDRPISMMICARCHGTPPRGQLGPSSGRGRLRAWLTRCASSLRWAGGFRRRGDRRLQRASIRAGLRTRHPMLYASCDASWKARGGDPISTTAC